MLILVLLLLLGCVRANTETHLISIPKYYNIPDYQPPNVELAGINVVNDSHYIVYDYPIQDKNTFTNSEDTIIMDPIKDGDSKNLLVKINNYNQSLSPQDLLFIKLCWPAMYPVDFDLSHDFYHSNSFNKDLNSFDIYLQIKVTGNFKSLNVNETQVKFKLVIERLPNWLPIPLEVYDTIVYLVDIAIIMYQFLPCIYNKLL